MYLLGQRDTSSIPPIIIPPYFLIIILNEFTNKKLH